MNKTLKQLGMLLPAVLLVLGGVWGGAAHAVDDSTTIDPENKPLPVISSDPPKGTLCGASTTGAIFAGGPSYCEIDGTAHDPKVSCPSGWNKRSISSARTDMPGSGVVITYSCVKA